MARSVRFLSIRYAASRRPVEMRIWMSFCFGSISSSSSSSPSSSFASSSFSLAFFHFSFSSLLIALSCLRFFTGYLVMIDSVCLLNI